MYLVFFLTFFFQQLCSLHIFKKVLHISNPTQDTPWVDICYSIIIAVILAGAEYIVPALRIFALVVAVFSLGVLYYKQKFNSGFAAALISTGLALVFYDIGLALSYPLAFGVAEVTSVSVDDVEILQLTRIVAGITQLLFSVLLFKIPRLKKGMPFLQTDRINDVGIIISIALLAGTIWISEEAMIQYHIVIVFACGMTLFVWWNNRLQESYREKQQKNQLVTLEQKLEQSRQRREMIESLNSKLAKQLHEDRRIIPALYSQLQYLSEIATFENGDRQQRRNLHGYASRDGRGYGSRSIL